MTTMDCAVCGALASASLFVREFVAAHGPRVVALPDVARWVCSSCGERFFDAAQSKDLSRRMKDGR